MSLKIRIFPSWSENLYMIPIVDVISQSLRIEIVGIAKKKILLIFLDSCGHR